MRMYDILVKKRDGKVLSDDEINFFVKGATDGGIPDYQISALLMAIYLRGMTDKETLSLTKAMELSGDTVDLSGIDGVTVDKHSTGGVGDKTSLIVAPIVASLGGKVAKMSGRGLGHTGGTIDKLESIKGFNTSLTPDEFLKQVKEIGISIVGQTGNLAPADKKFYGIRDVTATIDSLPLICSSIMSKKLASGASAIVLDVKTGSGSFMKTLDDSRTLAKKMVDIGAMAGRKVAAVITNMDIPLGKAVGNALEVKEAIEVLKGQGPDDLTKVCITLSSVMIGFVTGEDEKTCLLKAEDAIRSGIALSKFKEFVAYQGGDITGIDDTELLPKAKFKYELKSQRSGFITHMETDEIGLSSVMLGAGREKKEDKIDMGAGIIIEKKTGDEVSAGDVLCVMYADDESKFTTSASRYLNALTIGDEKPDKKSTVLDIIRG
ncbi:MAG: thymidine phosphorylase [Bacillota bacterium]|nr:thymidine phosphorylase [Bacillota bacterium]